MTTKKILIGVGVTAVIIAGSVFFIKKYRKKDKAATGGTDTAKDDGAAVQPPLAMSADGVKRGGFLKFAGAWGGPDLGFKQSAADGGTPITTAPPPTSSGS